MAKTPKPGDKVAWGTPQGETRGTVQRTVTSTTRVKGHVAKATRQDPQVEVRSDKTGDRAIHKPDELRTA